MKSIFSFALGIAISFGATVLAVGAGVLFAAGIGGGILVRERPGTARVLNYDPSNVVIRAVVTGAAALLIAGLYLVILRRLKRADRMRRRIG